MTDQTCLIGITTGAQGEGVYGVAKTAVLISLTQPTKIPFVSGWSPFLSIHANPWERLLQAHEGIIKGISRNR